VALKLFTPPIEEPVSVAEAKAHLRLDTSDEDALVGGLIVAARQWCEGYQNRAYVTQTWDLVLDRWSCEPDLDRIRIPLPPLQSVASLKYTDADDVQTTMPASEYLVDVASQPGRLMLAYGRSWPTVTLRPAAAIEIRFTAGYGAAAEVPETVKQAIKLLVGHLYEHREATSVQDLSEVPFAVKALLGLERIWPL
jgi:uncharacterized phiE125 gp8 family phage protein